MVVITIAIGFDVLHSTATQHSVPSDVIPCGVLSTTLTGSSSIELQINCETSFSQGQTYTPNVQTVNGTP